MSASDIWSPRMWDRRGFRAYGSGGGTPGLILSLFTPRVEPPSRHLASHSDSVWQLSDEGLSLELSILTLLTATLICPTNSGCRSRYLQFICSTRELDCRQIRLLFTNHVTLTTISLPLPGP
jgi:hypothetical protein